ncbi:hypothetical protein Q8A73_003177 [Channa argus]|nr:hypothetical protein Q8A73_003177 [Channa argus]
MGLTGVAVRSPAALRSPPLSSSSSPHQLSPTAPNHYMNLITSQSLSFLSTSICLDRKAEEQICAKLHLPQQPGATFCGLVFQTAEKIALVCNKYSAPKESTSGVVMLTWPVREDGCCSSCKQQEHVEQVEDPHGWVASSQKAHHGENPARLRTSFLRVISMCLRNVGVQSVCVSSESVIVSVSESKVTKVLLPPSPLYRLLEGGGSMEGVAKNKEAVVERSRYFKSQDPQLTPNPRAEEDTHLGLLGDAGRGGVCTEQLRAGDLIELNPEMHQTNDSLAVCLCLCLLP